MRFAVACVALALVSSACGGDRGDDDGSGVAADAMAGSIDAQSSPTWESFAEGFFETYCWACHGPGDPLRDYSQLSMVRAEMSVISAGIDSEQFPIGDGPMPTRDERDRLIQWIEAGAPE